MSESDLLRHCSAETRTKLNESIRLRERAVVLLKSLQDAKRRCDRQLTKSNRTDPMLQVTGRSSLDEAIATAKRTIDVLDRAAADVVGGQPAPSVVISGAGCSHERQPAVS